jgi:hypothetical protein
VQLAGIIARAHACSISPERSESNICEGNASSGIIINASSPYLSANRLLDNAYYGLVYGKSSKPTFGAKNAFAGNGKGNALTNATFTN